MKGSRASWTWASLLEGRDLVKNAGVRTLGNGRNIGAFTNAWVPGSLNSRIGEQPIIEAQANARVSDWIDTNTKSWNEDAMRLVLNDESEVSPNTYGTNRRQNDMAFGTGGGGRSQHDLPTTVSEQARTDGTVWRGRLRQEHV